MKTRFSPIVRVRKLEVEKSQRELGMIEGKLEQLERELAALQYDIAHVAFPAQGSFGQLQKSAHIVVMLKEEVEALKMTQHLLLSQRYQAMERLKKAMIESEKIEHLHKDEIVKIFEQRAKHEAKELDEMGMMLHVLKGER